MSLCEAWKCAPPSVCARLCAPGCAPPARGGGECMQSTLCCCVGVCIHGRPTGMIAVAGLWGEEEEVEIMEV